jgi:vitamin B12 transporter
VNKKYLAVKAAKYLLATILIIGLIEARVSAQEVKEIELEKIIVTNRRAAVGLSEATENVVVVNADEIRQLPVRNLGEALKYIAGIDIELRRGFGRSTSVSIQGSDSRQVRVMIDGIPLNPQSSGQVNLAVLPIEDIARIEIIKGAASSTWGSGLGAVINVITKDTGKNLIPEGSLTTAFAEFRTRKENGEISGKVGDVGYYLFSSYMESGGHSPKDDVLEKKGFGKLSYDLKDMGKITGSFGYSGADVNSGEFPDGTWLAQPYRLRYGKVGWEAAISGTDIRVDLKHSRQDTITKFYTSVEDEEPDLIKYLDLLYQLSLNSNIHLREKDLLVLGADFDCDTVKSNLFLTKAKTLQLQAPYANYTLKLEPWDLNFGLRYDHNSEFGEQISPSLGFIYHLEQIPDTLIRAGVSRAFNAPPLLWKYNYSQDWWTAPNPDIQPERAWVYELGLESKPISKLWIKFSLYRADVWDAIAGARNEAGLSYMKNFEKFRRQGLELQFKINLLEGLDFSASGAFNDIADRATRKVVKGGGKARESFGLGMDYRNKHGFNFSLKGYYDWWNEVATVYFNQLGEEISVDPNDRKMLFDVKISQEFKNFTFFSNIYNLFNSKYWRDYYFSLPERYFEGGVMLKW